MACSSATSVKQGVLGLEPAGHDTRHFRTLGNVLFEISRIGSQWRLVTDNAAGVALAKRLP